MSDDRGFDPQAIETLERMIGRRVAGEVIDAFFGSLPERMRAIRALKETGDIDAAAHALHSLKSSAGMLGAIDVQRLAETLEAQAWKKNADAVIAGTPEVEAAVSQVEPLLRAARVRLAG